MYVVVVILICQRINMGLNFSKGNIIVYVKVLLYDIIFY